MLNSYLVILKIAFLYIVDMKAEDRTGDKSNGRRASNGEDIRKNAVVRRRKRALRGRAGRVREKGKDNYLGYYTCLMTPVKDH